MDPMIPFHIDEQRQRDDRPDAGNDTGFYAV